MAYLSLVQCCDGNISPISLAEGHHTVCTEPQHLAGLPKGALNQHKDFGPDWYYHHSHEVTPKLRSCRGTTKPVSHNS